MLKEIEAEMRDGFCILHGRHEYNSSCAMCAAIGHGVWNSFTRPPIFPGTYMVADVDRGAWGVHQVSWTGKHWIGDLKGINSWAVSNEMINGGRDDSITQVEEAHRY